MQEYFVTYNQALALKELGFSEPCLGGWDKPGDWWWHPDSDITIDGPLKSQVFKWFRDQGFDFATLEKYKDKGKFYGGYISKSDDRFPNSFGSNFKTYEESESACIDKLISLIKEKKS